jgi:hypothetical protein
MYYDLAASAPPSRIETTASYGSQPKIDPRLQTASLGSRLKRSKHDRILAHDDERNPSEPTQSARGQKLSGTAVRCHRRPEPHWAGWLPNHPLGSAGRFHELRPHKKVRVGILRHRRHYHRKR